jgi:hypothetical protein
MNSVHSIVRAIRTAYWRDAALNQNIAPHIIGSYTFSESTPLKAPQPPSFAGLWRSAKPAF